MKWTFTTRQISDSEFDLMVTAEISEGFHLYSQFIPDGGPLPTSFAFENSSAYKRIGKIKESGSKHEDLEPMFDNMKLIWFEDKATFSQRVRLLKPEAIVKGTVTFMTCDDKMCDMPADQVFEFSLKGIPVAEKKADTLSKSAIPLIDSTEEKGSMDSSNDSEGANEKADSLTSASSAPIDIENNEVRDLSNWATFLKGFGLGLLALTFPCVWPIIPLTVSYFLKQNTRRRQGQLNATIYALSITVIFVALGILVSLITNGQKLNELSTGWFFNLLFFVLFFLFGLSFLGVFEITLPSSWINKSEALSEKGGLLGIFFMAFTLVLVSFSCTIPFVGQLITIVTDDGQFTKPLIGFAAFGLALGLPFGLFAMFPSALKKLPKSGHWMHVLKVTFGLLEIALSLIYLSKVDMAYHWNILSRDIFLAIWVIIFAVLGLYLLGRLRITADDDDSHISVPRLLTAIFCLAFALYMLPGLWGSPLKPLSGFLPNYGEFSPFEMAQTESAGKSESPEDSSENEKSSSLKKYSDLFHSPLGLDLYFDYDDALNNAKAQNKPLFVDFTGWGCVNCRKMEKSIWPLPEVLTRLKEGYVTASLYVDDRTPLPESERYYSDALKKEVKTLGDKNFDIQFSRFKMGAQPYYVLLDADGNLLNRPRGYTPNADEYVKFLDEGIAEFHKRKLASLK